MNTTYTDLMNNSTLVVKPSEGELHVNATILRQIGGVDSMARRLVSLWLLMPEVYRSMGYAWYNEANDFASFLAHTYGFTVWQIAQVIAVLSPQNPWDGKYNKLGKRMHDGNRLCAVRVIDAFYNGGSDSVMALRGWGYAPAFLAKSVLVLQGSELEWGTAPKTHRFALLIADPSRLDIAVIDSHASRIATGNCGARYHVVTKSAYAPIESAYIVAAKILGIPAYVLQAGTWTLAIEGQLYI